MGAGTHNRHGSEGTSRPQRWSFDRLLECHPSEAPNPEEALIAAEESNVIDLHGPPSTARRMAKVRHALERIPPREARAVRLTMSGMTLESVAEECQCAKSTAQWRIAKGLERIRWQVGPAAWFDALDISRDLAGRIPLSDVWLLQEIWETTSITETAKRHGWPHQAVGERFRRLVATLRAMAQDEPFLRRYGRGFSELHTWGLRLMWHASPRSEGQKRPPKVRDQKRVTSHG